MHPFHQLPSAPYRLSDDFDRLLSPSLVVFLDQVRENLQRMGKALGGDLNRWRPHVKTTKIPEVFQEVHAAGVRQFKCATTREARVLLSALGDVGDEQVDVLVAYPLLGPGLAQLAEVAADFPQARVSVVCEDPGICREIPASLGVFVDVNPDMNRTGIPRHDRPRIQQVAVAAGNRLRGIHFYDGHLHSNDAQWRRQQCFALYQDLESILQELQLQGLPIEEVVTSGTPTFSHAMAYPPFAELTGTIHRVSPGTVVYHDARSANLTELDLVPAAAVFSRVISHPTEQRITTDAGSKSIAAETGDPVALALGHPELVAETPSEEHLPFRVTQGPKPPRGTPLLLIPTHVCPTINLAEQAVLVEAGQIKDIVPVAARAHETLLFRKATRRQ
jgi:D-serine deaminase-like pyridoxal phosphate-dependent protein